MNGDVLMHFVSRADGKRCSIVGKGLFQLYDLFRLVKMEDVRLMLRFWHVASLTVLDRICCT